MPDTPRSRRALCDCAPRCFSYPYCLPSLLYETAPGQRALCAAAVRVIAVLFFMRLPARFQPLRRVHDDSAHPSVM